MYLLCTRSFSTSYLTTLEQSIEEYAKTRYHEETVTYEVVLALSEKSIELKQTFSLCSASQAKSRSSQLDDWNVCTWRCFRAASCGKQDAVDYQILGDVCKGEAGQRRSWALRALVPQAL